MNRILRNLTPAVLGSLLACAAPALGQNAASSDPAAELASFRLAEGFSINLFASEQDGVIKPIQARFDERGRLWVIGSTVYPQLVPGQVPDDKVIILEDTNGDGRADKSTVFASGLMIPTGIEITRDGCLVGNSTELIRLRDTDGDGRADVREVLLRGFGTGDNHQNLNSFQWGPGGELMFSQGLHSYSRVETPWGVERLDAAGIWRWRPRELRLDPFFGRYMAPHNPWGFVFDAWGQPLVLGGNGHGIFYPVPVMIRDHRAVDIDQVWKNHRGRKLCGADLVENAHFPPAWQGVLLAGGFMNNAVYGLDIHDDGAGFSVSDRLPLVTSTNTTFRPVDVKFGPDGALYVVDWFNPIIGHYQASFRHPDRDKLHGRIWRITANGHPPTRQPDIARTSIPGLLDLLKSRDRFTRQQAKRTLGEADSGAVVKAVKAWVETLPAGDTAAEHALFEAVGVLEWHEAVEPRILDRLAAARDPRARAYAARVLGHWHDRMDGALARLIPLLSDENPRVRLEALVSAAALRNTEASLGLLGVLDKPLDSFLNYALHQAIHVLKPYWLPHLAALPLKRMEYVVRADGSPDTLDRLRLLAADSSRPLRDRETLLALLGELGAPNDLAALLNPSAFADQGRYDAGIHARVLSAIVRSQPVRRTQPDTNAGPALARLLDSPASTASLRADALRLAGLWNITALAERLAGVAADREADITGRLAAIEALGRFGTGQSTEVIRRLAQGDPKPLMQAASIAALVPGSPDTARELAAGFLHSTQGDPGPVGTLLAAFTARKGAADRLAEALRATPPSRDSARLALRWLQSVGVSEKRLSDVLLEAAQLGGDPLKATPGFVRDLVAEVRAHGDAARGAQVFRRPDLNCLSCHAVGAEGGNIGPDLNSIGSGQPLDFIIGAVLEPNREVKESFEAIEVTTKDGESYTGYRAHAAAGQFALRDVTRNEIVRFRRDQISKISDRGSVMPAGLVDHLTRAELRDLFRYLSELGRAKP